uniref:Cyclin n=1 Tax=Rhodosorus marinus TaxID=101924 RepID=A0A7S0BK33_9RHOD|mmetsp:Transcript_20016/g.29125  ORF Transcript_20016/g.29125 Transcript_20016/m.29125 type:complete len:189 (+) Transcript_20016:311-877(+)
MDLSISFEDEEYLPLTDTELIDAVCETLEWECNKCGGVGPGSIPQEFSLRAKGSISIAAYVARLYEFLDCSDSVFVTALIYLRRIQRLNGDNRLTHLNVQKLFATATLLALKFLDDEHYGNDYMAQIFGMASLEEINRLEVSMLSLLGFRMSVSSEEFFREKALMMNDMVSSPTVFSMTVNQSLAVRV